MKTIAAPLAALDGNSLPLDADAAEGDEATPGEGFDAMLALINAQSQVAPVAVKPLAASVGGPFGSLDLTKPSCDASATPQLTGKSGQTLLSMADTGPTRAFLPWLGAAVGGDAPGLLKVESPVAGAEPGKGGTTDDELSEPKVSELAPDGTASASLLALSAAQPKPAEALRAASSDVSVSAAAKVAPVAPKAPLTELVSELASDAEGAARAPDAVFTDVLATKAKAVAMTAPPAPSDVAPAATQSIPMSDPDSKAVVTKIEFYESSASGELLEQLLGEATAELAPVQGEAAKASESDDPASTQQDPGTSQRDASPEQNPEAPAAPAARFEVTESRGMRGLDAVVASLLRPYSDKPEGAGGVRVPTANAPRISVETGKSMNVKVEERLTNVAQTLDAAAQRREEEQRHGDLREMLELGSGHVPHHAELAPNDFGAAIDAPPQASATPLNVPLPVPMPDSDAALMGKLARGESLNAAVSINHPELGAMDVLVENANGRIDVRATMDTPRAAAVLRAHESALRYGVQQAGMTFGALRVRARTGEPQTERSRDADKRRRDRDWEA